MGANQNARKLPSTDLVNTNNYYCLFLAPHSVLTQTDVL